jgi:hypothetical protein
LTKKNGVLNKSFMNIPLWKFIFCKTLRETPFCKFIYRQTKAVALMWPPGRQWSSRHYTPILLANTEKPSLAILVATYLDLSLKSVLDVQDQ